jgi:hypothetical protein
MLKNIDFSDTKSRLRTKALSNQVISRDKIKFNKNIMATDEKKFSISGKSTEFKTSVKVEEHDHITEGEQEDSFGEEDTYARYEYDHDDHENEHHDRVKRQYNDNPEFAMKDTAVSDWNKYANFNSKLNDIEEQDSHKKYDPSGNLKSHEGFETLTIANSLALKMQAKKLSSATSQKHKFKTYIVSGDKKTRQREP